MLLKEYIENRKSFRHGDLCFNVAHFFADTCNHMLVRLVFYTSRPSNRDGTNGVRISDERGMRAGFYCFLGDSEIAQACEILTQESREYAIQFILDDELNNQEGRGIRIFYKMKVLRSRVVA